MANKKKLRIPKSVFELKWTPNKFAKKHNIKTKGKGMKKKERKRAKKRLYNEYSDFAINNLNKAVKIISDHPLEGDKKIEKVMEGIDNIISNPLAMKKIAAIYKKDRKRYDNLSYLPYMITTTILYYSSSDLSEEEQKIAENLNKESLISFCEDILKKEIKKYRNAGLSKPLAFQMATAIPNTKCLTGRNSRKYYKRLIQTMYTMAEHEDIDTKIIYDAVRKLDKKSKLKKDDFFNGLYSEFMLNRSTNKAHTFNDTQKELHETLIEETLTYLDNIRNSKSREILKTYIKRRKTAEKHKNDTKRVIKFIDHANSNSSYGNLKKVIQELISDNSNNELYLS